VRKKGKFSVKNNAKKLDFLYNWERANVQEELWVWLKFTQMAKMYADCFCGREFKSVGVGPIMKLTEASL